jgi:MOSC domain-containing protein YiiM
VAAPRIVSINVARAADLAVGGGRRVKSAIAKCSVGDRAVAVRPLGLDGDEQADLSVHGGPSKAVYAYPSEHYGFWRTVRAQAGVAAWDAELEPGALGENLTLEGLVESDAWIGDRLRLGNCELAISEPRFPCVKFDAAMGFAQAGRLMSDSAWCGFYLAVTSPGTLSRGDRFELVPGPREVGIVELFRARLAGRRR